MDIGSVLKFERVSHEDQIYHLVALHFYSVNTVDSREKRLRVLFEMLIVIWQNLLHEFLFTFGHSLDDKASVVAEEEKTATSAGSLT